MGVDPDEDQHADVPRSAAVADGRPPRDHLHLGADQDQLRRGPDGLQGQAGVPGSRQTHPGSLEAESDDVDDDVTVVGADVEANVAAVGVGVGGTRRQRSVRRHDVGADDVRRATSVGKQEFDLRVI